MEVSPRHTAALARKIEQMGFDILLCPDTQNLSPEPYGQLSLAAAQTTRLKLGTGVTNPLTRDAAVTASAITTLQVESGGRCICGIGRGGLLTGAYRRGNATTAQLKTYIEQVRAYTRGETVMRRGQPSNLRWLDPDSITPVPVDIACTGPKTHPHGGRRGRPHQLRRRQRARTNRMGAGHRKTKIAGTGRSRDDLQIGAYINLICDQDEQTALNLGRMISAWSPTSPA